MSFEHYCNQVQDRIKRFRRDLDADNAEWILKANSPYELKPENNNSSKGILLIHGLLDSPYTMHDLAKFFQQQGFVVRVILLTGHGTIPEQLKEVDYHQWIEDVTLAVRSFKKHITDLYLCGFSTGGLLSLHHCLTDDDIKAVITLCPALKLNPVVALGTQLLNWTKRIIERDYWNVDNPENDPTKYTEFPMNAPHQVASLADEFQRLNKSNLLKTPLFMAMSADDETVSAHAGITFFHKQDNYANRMIYYTNDEVKIDDRRIKIVRSENESQHILNYSHIGIPISPDNPHYGIDGDYQQPIHYHDKDNPTVYHGALTRYSIKNYNVQRLSYNPHFSELCSSIIDFIDSL